jgi:hypothetical protein
MERVSKVGSWLGAVWCLKCKERKERRKEGKKERRKEVSKTKKKNP